MPAIIGDGDDPCCSTFPPTIPQANVTQQPDVPQIHP